MRDKEGERGRRERWKDHSTVFPIMKKNPKVNGKEKKNGRRRGKTERKREIEIERESRINTVISRLFDSFSLIS